MLRLFGWLGLTRRDPHFEQEVHKEIKYLTHAFPDDPLAAAQDRLRRRSPKSSEYRGDLGCGRKAAAGQTRLNKDDAQPQLAAHQPYET